MRKITIGAATLITFLLLASTILRGNITVTDIRYNIGTNGYDLFCGTLHGEDTNAVYMWQQTDNLGSGHWVDCWPTFAGHPNDDVFWTPAPHGDTNKFFRLIVVGNFIQTSNIMTYDNETISHFPSTNVPPLPPIM